MKSPSILKRFTTIKKWYITTNILLKFIVSYWNCIALPHVSSEMLLEYYAFSHRLHPTSSGAETHIFIDWLRTPRCGWRISLLNVPKTILWSKTLVLANYSSEQSPSCRKGVVENNSQHIENQFTALKTWQNSDYWVIDVADI